MNKIVGNKCLLVISPEYNYFVKDQVDMLSNYFHKIYVFIPINPIAEISNFLPINYLKRFRRKTLIDLKDKPSNVIVISTPLLYVPALMDSQYKKLGDKLFNAVNKQIKKDKIKFDLIHAHFTWPYGYVAKKLKEEYGVPFIVTAHGYDIYDLPFRDSEWTKKIKSVLDRADYIITVSKNNQKCINNLNVETLVKVIPNGFRSDLFFPKNLQKCLEDLNLKSNRKIILSIGNLIKIKGHKYLIDAFNEVIKHRKDIICIIIGYGNLKNKLERQIHNLGLKDHIILVGGKPHYEIPLWINASDIFVLPSLNEGNPTVMFEALGCGKPFIGTRVGGVPEIINSIEYGLLVEPEDSKDLAEKILTALDTKWNSKKIIIYAKRFSWNRIVKKIIEVYVRALD